MKLLSKIKQMPQGVKASVALFISSIVTKGISYLTTPVFTRMLSSGEYGQVSVYMTWFEIFGIVAMFCLSYGVFNNGMLDYPDKRDEYSFSMLILSNLITVCFSGILLCLYPLIHEFLGIDLPLLILMFALFLALPAYRFWAARQRYELKYKWTVFWSITNAFLSPLVAILCVLIWQDEKVYARIFGAEVVLLAVYIAFYIYLAIKAKGKINTGFWKSALIFNLPLIPHYLSTYLLGSSDKIMISNFIGDSATAYYSVAYSIASVLMVVWSAINSSLIPFTYEKCKEDDYESVSKVTSPILTVFAVVCGALIMLAPEVLYFMATTEYLEAVAVIPACVGGVFFQVQYYIYANIVYYRKKPVFVMIASVVATVVNLVLNYIFIPKYGYVAAGYTTLISYFLQATIDYFAMRKVVGEKVYNMRYIGVLSLIVIAVSLLSNLIYDYMIIRYAIVAIVAVLAIIFRKKIIRILKVSGGKDET